MFETHRNDGRQSFNASGAERDVGDNLLDEACLQKDPTGVVPDLQRNTRYQQPEAPISCQSHKGRTST